ncbi:MAG: hypothetical protein CSA68_00845 [Rhodobacterales bacterium]|nr:MAG: hypothetical protein CSA68_00845 [Rhodobacterales bacterium]
MDRNRPPKQGAKDMAKILGPLLAALFLSCGSGYASSLHEDFAELMERCRIAIEQSTPLDKTGLRQIQVHEKNRRSGFDWPEHAAQPDRGHPRV